MNYMNNREGIRGFLGALTMVEGFNVVVLALYAFFTTTGDEYNVAGVVLLETIIIAIVIILICLGYNHWGWFSDKD